jgi:hypothetical protein
MTTGAYFSRAANLQRLHEGPLGIYIDLYASHLVREGYRRPTAWRCLRLVADFSRWLEHQQLGIGDVDEQATAQYLVDRAELRRPQTGDRPTLRKLLAVLRQVDAIAPRGPVEQSARERIFEDFAGYLARERGLARATIVRHWPAVRMFLEEAGIEEIGDFAKLDQAAVIGFVERHARDHSPGTAKSLCWALRTFLRYLRRGRDGPRSTSPARCRRSGGGARRPYPPSCRPDRSGRSLTRAIGRPRPGAGTSRS